MILVSSGRSGKIGTYTFPVTVEILDLLNPKFKFSFNDARSARDSPVGGLVQNQPIVCGGNLFNSGCMISPGELEPIIVLGQPKKKIEMLKTNKMVPNQFGILVYRSDHPPQRSGNFREIDFTG